MRVERLRGFGPDMSSMEDFTVRSLLIDSEDERIRLERQPLVIAEALGRLLNVLADKGVLNGPDVCKVLGIWDETSVEFIKDES